MDDANQDFYYRNTGRRDVAQMVAEEYFTDKKIFWRNFGTDPKDDNPVPGEMFFKMPSFIQRTPDMFAINSKFVFVEVKGCKDKLKIKIDDYKEYVKWNQIAPLMFFIYSTTMNEKYLFSIEQFDSKLKGALIGAYNDNGKVYFEIDIKDVGEYLVN